MTSTTPPNRARAPRLVVGSAVGALVGIAVFSGLAAAGVADRTDHAATSPLLVERPECTSSPAQDTTEHPGVGQGVGVTVRPTALLHLDAHGHVTAAWTNTGCAPRRTDDLFVHAVDGSIRPGNRSLVTRRWIGDFRDPGVLVDQSATG